MMVVVMVLAVMLGTAEGLRRRRASFQQRAKAFAQKLADALMYEHLYRLSHRFVSYDSRPSAQYKRLVEHYNALRVKYERAADRPWWFVGPDPPEPDWPKDLPRP
jgi:hypothetical protein